VEFYFLHPQNWVRCPKNAHQREGRKRKGGEEGRKEMKEGREN
jgi:hypothetical protein